MVKRVNITVQDYPRIKLGKDAGLLDDTQLAPHHHKIPLEEMRSLIASAIENANQKSSREILSIPLDASEEEISRIYSKEGKNLFAYFKKYFSDPAAAAHQMHGKHYTTVGKELFHNRTLQKERMNSGWRYQYLSVDCARLSRRFRNVSDIGAAEADFNAIINYIDPNKKPLSLYVSVKNRSNTMGGQDWPKAIQALENVANTDKNRIGDYCCVFGIAMDRGKRYIKRTQKTKAAHSVNTEVWMSDYFWPFFANYSYEEIMTLMLDVLMKTAESSEFPSQIEIPNEVLDVFGLFCKQHKLVNEGGIFNDPYRLVRFFTGS